MEKIQNNESDSTACEEENKEDKMFNVLHPKKQLLIKQPHNR